VLRGWETLLIVSELRINTKSNLPLQVLIFKINFDLRNLLKLDGSENGLCFFLKKPSENDLKTPFYYVSGYPLIFLKNVKFILTEKLITS
jgi:hypothetical protein